MNILVTGGGGYIGRHVAYSLMGAGYQVAVTVRDQKQAALFDGTAIKALLVQDLHDASDTLFAGYEVVVHCAGSAHKKYKSTRLAIDENRRHNAELATHLVGICIRAQVRRVVVVSSIGASLLERDIAAHKTTLDNAWEVDAYRASKLQADVDVIRMLEAPSVSTECAIIRPPMVYGQCAPGNFALLSRLIKLRVPLPLYDIQNKRAFISIDNLCSFVLCLVQQPSLKTKIWEVRDAEEISTRDFVTKLAHALGVPAPLFFPMPAWLLYAVGRVLGLRDAVDSLIGDLHIELPSDISAWDWKPRKTCINLQGSTEIGP